MNDLVGLILPPVIDLVNHRVSSPSLKLIVSVALSLFVGALLNFDKLQVASAEDILKAGLAVFGSAQVSYQLYWKKSLDRQQMVTKLQGKA